MGEIKSFHIEKLGWRNLKAFFVRKCFKGIVTFDSKSIFFNLVRQIELLCWLGYFIHNGKQLMYLSMYVPPEYESKSEKTPRRCKTPFIKWFFTSNTQTIYCIIHSQMHLFLAMNGSALNRQIYIADLSAPRVTAEPRTLDDQSPCTVLLPPFYFLLCKCFEFFILTLVSLKYPKIEQKVLYKPTKSSRLGKSDIINRRT